MSIPVVFTAAAEADVAEAHLWYRERGLGLGDDFVRAVDASVAGIARHPESHSVMHRGVRRALLRRFPYGLFYVVQPDRIVVLACFHAARDPRIWRSRGAG